MDRPGPRRLFVCSLLLGGLGFLAACDAEPPAPGLIELAARSADSESDAVSLKAIPPSDLPPEGTRSLFDHIIKENGSLPFPFERLIDLLASYDEAGSAPLTLLIPDGRSLLKGQADFTQPRIVVAATAEPSITEAMLEPMLKGRLFLGFVEGADEIEIISYNEAAGRFEFQLVKDYREGGVPRLVYAKRAICTTCHAGSGPIFPTRPWEETSAQPAIQKAIAEERDSVEPYHGARLDNKLADAEAFDALTDKGNLIPVAQRLWLDGCGASGAGNLCRQQMLLLALRYLWDPAAFNPEDDAGQRLRELQAVAWPESGIALDNGDLLNRNPFTDHPADYNWIDWIQSWFDDGRRVAKRQAGQDTVAAFESQPRLRAEVDPLSPRLPKKVITARDMDAVYALAQMFTPADRQRLEAASDFNFERLRAALDLLPESVWQAQPFSRVMVMQSLLSALGSTAPDYCCRQVEEMSAPMVDGAPPLEIGKDSVLQHFQTYCFGCHRGNPAARLDFMNGSSEEEVLAHIQDVPKIREVLDYERYLGTDKEAKLMPPANSYQRRMLDEVRQQGGEDLEKMVEAVPGLFDF